MKSALLASLLVGFVSGASAGAAVLFLRAPGSTSAATPPATLLPDEVALLRDQVSRLQAKNEELSARLVGLELQRPVEDRREPAGDFVTRAELDEALAEVRARPAQLEQGEVLADSERQAFKRDVASALKSIRKDERVEAVREYQEKRSARIDEDMVKLDKVLKLTPYQSSEVRTALIAQYEREAELRQMWEDGVDAAIVGERKRSDGETFKADLEAVLDQDQVETFWREVARGGKR